MNKANRAILLHSLSVPVLALLIVLAVRWLPVAPLLAAVVQRLHDGGSVAELLA